MNDEEARKFAQRCIDTWPNGPKAYIWRDAVIDLQPGPAAGAYRQLMRESIKTPTVGQFMAHYANLTHHDNQPRTGIVWRGDEIGLSEYLERVGKRAGQGNTEAQEELDRWERWLTGKKPA